MATARLDHLLLRKRKRDHLPFDRGFKRVYYIASKCWQGMLSLLDNLNIFHRKANATLWNSGYNV